MIQSKSSRDVQRVRHRGSPAEGPQTYVTSYFGPVRGGSGPAEPEPPLGVLCPVAYLIDQEPGPDAPPHFHQADQFQVIVAGGGFIGKHAVPRISVHYASAYTPYGPIRPGPDGISYMTLRNGHDPRAMRMPRERGLLKRVGRKPRATVGEAIAPLSREQLLALRDATATRVFEPQPDQLAAWVYRLAPESALPGPDPQGSGGQFWLVIGGEFVVGDGPALPAMSCAFVSPEDPALTAKAGAAGCEVLALQFAPSRQAP